MFFLRLPSFIISVVILSSCASTPPPPVRTDVASGPTTIDVQILAFNDFHGNLEPPGGSGGRIGEVEAGGVEFMATHIARLRATNPNTVVVSAGDNIGASPLVSALFHDEPTIAALDALGLDFSTVGNHEFDEGWRELLRMQNGGCHPVDGCKGSDSFGGASFKYLSANVRVDERNETLFPATAVKTFDGVSVGFIGLALADTPSLVAPSGIVGVTFLPEAAAANAAARELRQQGVETIVVLFHQGGFVDAGDENTCRTLRGGLVPVLKALSSDISVVVTGHTNRIYACHINGKLVTSAASYGRLVTDIDLKISRVTGRLVSSTARNVTMTRDVPRELAQTTILDRYRPIAADVGRRPVGSIAASLPRAANAAGESTLGNVVADGLLTISRENGAQIAFMNHGGLRADLTHPGDPAAGPHDLTYGDIFSLLPFGNAILVKTITGDVLMRILEQQFDNPSPGQRTMLQPSSGFSYSYDVRRSAGRRVDRRSMMLDGKPVQPNQTYRVAMPDFLWDGGDGFTTARSATDAVVQGLDIDVFLEYLAAHSPLRPGPQDRIRMER